MRVRITGLARLAGLALLALAATAAAAQDWATAFATAPVHDGVHAAARYRAPNGTAHRLELWRVGDRFLRRKTDDRLDLYVRTAGEGVGGYAYRLVDHSRRVVIDVARSNLHRIGVFAQWDGLAHVLTPPQGGFEIEPVDGPQPEAPRIACEWHRIAPEPPGAFSDVCWSSEWGLPALVVPASGQDVRTPAFEIDFAEPIEDAAEVATWPAVPTGYDFVDADSDIDPNGD